jgi:hypothetical protein
MSAAWMLLAGALLGLVIGACLGVALAILLLRWLADDTPEVVDVPPTHHADSRRFWIAAAVLSAIGVIYTIHAFGLVTP